MASFPHLIDVGIMGHCLHGKLGLCAKAGIQQGIRKREHYEKPSVRRKKKSEAARKRKFN